MSSAEIFDLYAFVKLYLDAVDGSTGGFKEMVKIYFGLLKIQVKFLIN